MVKHLIFSCLIWLCKDTTFFWTDQIFVRIFFNKSHNSLIYTKKKFNKEERFLIDTPKFLKPDDKNWILQTKPDDKNWILQTKPDDKNWILQTKPDKYKKKIKFFLTVNQVLTKKIGKKLEKNLVSSENGSIFASRNKGEKNPKQKKKCNN